MTLVYYLSRKKKSQDLGGNRTHNLRNSGVMLSYQALENRVVGSKVFVYKCASWCNRWHHVIPGVPIGEP